MQLSCILFLFFDRTIIKLLPSITDSEVTKEFWMVILIIEDDIFLQLEVTEVFAKSTIAPVYSLSDVNQIVILS
jgi:hypothetical protein